MHKICSEVFKFEEQGNDAKFRLEEVIINLSLVGESSRTSAAGHATNCAVYGDMNSTWTFKRRARALVERMARPRMVRLLKQEDRGFRLRAYDVLTGKSVTLRENADWDEEAEPGDDEDEESENSNLDSSNDDEYNEDGV